jgi:hypothetical protein
MPRYYRKDEEEYMFESVDSERKNLYHIITEIGVSQDFLDRHASYFDDATTAERLRKRQYIQEKINRIEERGGKTNYQDMYEMYGRVPSLWDMVVQTQKLSEDFIERHMEKLGRRWQDICRYQRLSDDFMRRHSDNLSWWNVAYFQDYSEEFLLEFFDQIYDAIKHDRPKYDPHNGFLRIRKPSDERLIVLLKMRGIMP